MLPKRVQESPCLDKVASIILAGGQGTRLMPLTAARCKPAVCFGGRYRLIDIPISNSLNAELKHLFVISQFHASNLNEHILATYPIELFRNGGLELLCPEERPSGKLWFKGTADAVRQNLVHLEKFPFEYYLILSGDQLYTMDLRHMIEFAEKEKADLVIASLSVEEAEARRMGLLKINQKNEILDFIEKPSDPQVLKDFRIPGNSSPEWLGSMGIYVFKKEALFHLLSQAGDDFGKDLIPKQLKLGKCSAFIYRGYWEDIGTVSSYYHANLALLRQKNCLNLYDEFYPIYTRPYHLPSPLIRDTVIKDSLISQGAVIEAKEIIGSLIGIHARIGANTVIHDSIVLGNPAHPTLEGFSIGKNCLIKKAIIDEEVFIGDDVKLSNTKNLQTFDSDSVYIRDGIIIVPSGAHIPSGYQI